MVTIPELADQARRGCDEDERLAQELQAWGPVEGPGLEFHKLMGNPLLGPFGGQSPIRNWGTGQDIAKLADPARVLAEAAAKRALLDLALGWRHFKICGVVLREACDCGREERVRAVLEHLARPYSD